MNYKLKSLVRTLVLFNSLVVITPIPAFVGNVKLFLTPITYAAESTVLLNDVASGDKEVGYKVKSTVYVDPVWSESDRHFLLKFEIHSPKLHVRSKTAPHEGFIEHSSLLDGYLNEPFFAEWQDGMVPRVFINSKEDPTWANYKKGIISVFQLQIMDVNLQETDISGTCDVWYDSLGPNMIRKIKTKCHHEDLPNPISNGVLSATSTSGYITKYDFTEDLTTLFHIYAEEYHDMALGIKQDAGCKIRVWHDLKFLEKRVRSAEVKGDTLADALSAVEANYGYVMRAQSLKMNVFEEGDEKKYDLAKVIKENREQLRSEQLGTESSALAFLRVLRAMRAARTEEILGAVRGVKNKEIILQLCDLLGYTQTVQAHDAAKEFLNFENEYDRENVERYLWALSIGPAPRERVILDLLKMRANSKLPPQLSETLLHTVAAMTHKYLNNGGNNTDSLLKKVKDHITSNLSKCKEDAPCIVTYLRALQNLKHTDSVKILIDHIRKGNKIASIMALKALRAMPTSFWSKDVIVLCKKVLYQLEKPYDSSARTLAADIMIEADPPFYEIEELLNFLASTDKEFEVKQFVLQRLQMMSHKIGKIKFFYDYYLRKHTYINNYDVLAQKGLSTALLRNVSSNSWSNVSLVSVQEISGGMLKRGHVDLEIQDKGVIKRVFSLGLYATGLSSMTGGSSEESDDDTATAGMELDVLGVHIRPFTFFSGQGELMGHVWSGTASERTTAFQSLMLVQEVTGHVILGIGSLAKWNMDVAASVDLAGQIQLSLWSRTAHTVVDKAVGIVVQGSYKADTHFVKSEVKFSLSLEPRVDLESDIDFYDGVKLCIQVKQPDIVIRQNVTKVEWIPDHSHVLRKRKYKSIVLPGRTYALNRKNNIMCNEIHDKK